MELVEISDRAAVSEGAFSESVSACLSAILEIPDLEHYGVPRIGNHFSDSLWLYFDTSMSIVCGPLPKLFSVPVHNHGTWEAMALYRGAIKYTSYHRADNGDLEYYAKLEVEKDLILRAGDVALTPSPPHDVHCFTGLADDTYAVSVIGNPLAAERMYFDPDREYYIRRTPQEWKSAAVPARARSAAFPAGS